MIDHERVLDGLKACLERNEETIASLQKTIDTLTKAFAEKPEIIHCKDCKYWIPGKIDLDNFEAPRCKRIIGIWESHEYCSCAERKVNQG